MRTRHLVGLISGVLILSVLLPVGLSIWLAHQQVETSFIEELDTYSSRVAIRANKVATQGKDALQELERWQGAACSGSPSHGNASGILQLSLYSGSGLYR
ncbi:putative signal transduction protein [Escherichia coli]|nr:putative signal transduction protein [Escherichia coli]